MIDLHVALPGPQRKLAQGHELVNLGGVAGVGQAARTARVAQRDGHVVGTADLEHLVEALIVGVLLPRHHHPGEHERTTARHHVHEAAVVLDTLGHGAVHAAVQGHEVHAVLGVHAQHVEPFVGGDVLERLAVVHHGVVDGHRADDGGALGRELAAEGPGVAEGREVHDRLGPHGHGVADLLHLHVEVAPVAAGAQVHVDLGLERKADAVGVEDRVVHVGGDHGLALGDERAQGFGVDALLGGDGLHLRGDDALAGGVHLGGVGHGGLLWG